MNRTVAFCTTCKGRLQHLVATLSKNLELNSLAKFVVLNYNSQDNLLAYLQESQAGAIASGRLTVYSYFDHPTFRMSHAKNMAHRCGLLDGADILVNVDADNYAGKGFDQYVQSKFDEPDIFLWSRMIKDGPQRLPRGISGRIAVSRHAFLNVGGYDEQFVTWGPDDKDFNVRLRNIGQQAQEIDRRFLDGVLHNDKTRFRDYPEAQTDADAEAFEQVRYHGKTVVNFGNVGCGTVFKNFSNEPIELAPLPTRIFGVGMHKTGTTSLHKAMQILGIKSGHWKSAHWAKAIWQEMKSGRSKTLEEYYALCDLPITLLYEELDKSYPGSKFILTTRDDHKWLASVERHWSPAFNHFRAGWDSDPFTHQIHQELYGQRTFDKGVFLARFRKHNADVQEYFQNRPGDLLVMNIDQKPSWGSLCGFLGKPVPSQKYPRAYATEVGNGEVVRT